MKGAVVEIAPFVPVVSWRQSPGEVAAINAIDEHTLLGQKQRQGINASADLEQSRFGGEILQARCSPWVVNGVRVVASVDAEGAAGQMDQLSKEIGALSRGEGAVETLLGQVGHRTYARS